MNRFWNILVIFQTCLKPRSPITHQIRSETKPEALFMQINTHSLKTVGLLEESSLTVLLQVKCPGSWLAAQADRPGSCCSGKQHTERPHSLSPRCLLLLHKAITSRTGQVPPLPKTYVTEDSGSRKKGILGDLQLLLHLEE